jgi:hypothetical protein
MLLTQDYGIGSVHLPFLPPTSLRSTLITKRKEMHVEFWVENILEKNNYKTSNDKGIQYSIFI